MGLEPHYIGLVLFLHFFEMLEEIFDRTEVSKSIVMVDVELINRGIVIGGHYSDVEKELDIAVSL